MGVKALGCSLCIVSSFCFLCLIWSAGYLFLGGFRLVVSTSAMFCGLKGIFRIGFIRVTSCVLDGIYPVSFCVLDGGYGMLRLVC